MKNFCKNSHDLSIKGRDKIGRCKECRKQGGQRRYRKDPKKRCEYLRKWRKANPERSRLSIFLYATKIRVSLAQVAELYKIQDNCCALCKRHETEFTKRLSIDHNHQTGKIRGLLCANCNNRVVKVVEDHSDLIPKAQKYLDNYK